MVDTDKLWVNLSSMGNGNIFAVLPQLMKQILSDDMFDIDDNFVNIILPSNDAWQAKIYYKLIETQRLLDSNRNEE